MLIIKTPNKYFNWTRDNKNVTFMLLCFICSLWWFTLDKFYEMWQLSQAKPSLKSLKKSTSTCLHIFWGWRSQTSSGESMAMSIVLLWHTASPGTNLPKFNKKKTGLIVIKTQHYACIIMKGETEIEMSIVLLWEKAFPGTLVQWLALSHCYWLNIFSKQQGALWPKSIHSKIDQNKNKSY